MTSNQQKNVNEQLCLDGNIAVAMSAYKLIDTCFMFPITPSSPIPENIEMYAAQGKLNAFGNVVVAQQMQSELGACAALHGASKAGSLACTFTSSQGLLLMIPNIYFLANCHQPAVIHLACRSVGMSSTSLSPDHTDIYAISNTGICAINSRCVQECHDMALCTHLAAMESHQAFVHFFAGFRVSHQFETFTEVDMDTVKKMIDHEAIADWRKSNGVISCEDPQGMGCGMGPEYYYQVTESQKYHFRTISPIVQRVFQKFEKFTGRHYEIMEYTGAQDAEKVIVLLGEAALTTEMVVKKLVNEHQQKVGVISIRLWRPFDASYFIKILPKTCTKIVIADRVRDHTSVGGLLYNDCLNSIYQANLIDRFEVIKMGTYGICGIDLQPRDILQMFEDLDNKSTKIMRIGVNDDEPDCLFNHKLTKYCYPRFYETLFSEKTKQSLVYSLGSDGSIGAFRNCCKILSEVNPSIQQQMEPVFDGKKSGGLVQIHLRLSDEKIKGQYDISEANYIAIHQETYIHKFPEMLKAAAPNGTVFINCTLTPEQLPANMKKMIAEKNLHLVMFNCNKLAEEVGIPGRISMITGVFAIKYAFDGLMELHDACERMKQQARITYAKQSAQVIQSNMDAVDKTLAQVDNCEVKYDRDAWLNAVDPVVEKKVVKLPELLQEGHTFDKVMKQQYSQITVKEVQRFSNGAFPAGYSKFERRMASEKVAHWTNVDDCIQCYQCAVICPHATIRPFILTDAQSSKYQSKDSKDGKFRIQVSPVDCQGCTLCSVICPKKCITMVNINKSINELHEQDAWDDLVENNNNPKVNTKTCTLKELQYAEPYMFSNGSCPGCQEGTILRMLTQIYGKYLQLSSPVGCQIIIQQFNSFRPLTVDNEGHGVAASTSAFEDNCSYGVGEILSHHTLRNNLRKYITENKDKCSVELQQAMQKWLENYDKPEDTYQVADALRNELNKQQNEISKHILDQTKLLPYQTHWITMGDGAVNIEGNGLEQALRINDRIRILVLNNQCFANTGGQYSWLSPEGAVTKHAYMGVNEKTRKMSFQYMINKNAYVAQIAADANPAQALKAIREAEEYDGPALIIAYCACLNHTIQGGLKNGIQQAKAAVACGAWNLFRFNPKNEKGKKLMIDAKRSVETIDEYISKEQRFMVLEKKNKERFQQLKAAHQKNVDEDQELLALLQQE